MIGRALLATMLLVLVGTSPAWAHGTFIDVRPLPGVDVGGTVDEVAFLFPEPLAGEGSIVVFGPDGAAIAARGDLEFPAESVARLPVGSLEAPGEYRVEWRLPAVDGYVFEGDFAFRYDPSSEPLDPLPFARDDRSPWLIGAVVVGLAGFAVVARRIRRDPGQ